MDLMGQRQFDARLTLELAREEGNLFVSPFSAWSLLALLCPGSRGETRDRLSGVLGLPTDAFDESWITELRELTSSLKNVRPRSLEDREPPRSLDLIIANALWLQTGYLLEPAYLAQIREGFDARIEELDLTGKPTAACETINRWADENTRGKIDQVLSPDQIGSLTRLILSNATYFKDDWAEKFDPEATRIERFHRLEGRKVEVSMMHQTRSFDYFEDKSLQAIRLPYAHEGLSMVVVLPRRIRKFEASLSPQSLDQIFASLRWELPVHLALPKCQMRDQLVLDPPLKAMGLETLFDESADLSGISPEPGVQVDQVQQATFVQVDEQGTEAAAVTIATVTSAALHEVAPEPKQMIVDRPYWFFIRHDPSGCLLFAGRVEDPS